METRVSHSVVVGLSWRTASQQIRDRAHLSIEAEAALAARLHEKAGIEGVVVLSTCNRIELYFSAQDPGAASLQAWEIWREACGLDDPVRDNAYFLLHEEAVFHLFQVATSVDSIVQGETQIANQIRDALQRAQERGLGSFLQRLFQDALASSKRIRTATSLGEGTVSIASAAVQLASEQRDLANAKVGILGAGVMAEAAWRHFRSKGARDFVYCNRHPERFEAWCREVPAPVCSLEGIGALLACDVVLVAVRSHGHLVTPPMVQGRSLLLLDISAPRVVSPECARNEDVQLFAIDDLQAVVDKNRQGRADQAQQAAQLVEEEVQRFCGWVRSRSILDPLKATRERSHAIALDLARRHSRHLERQAGTEVFPAELEGFARLLVNKLLHAPLHAAVELASQGDEEQARVLLESWGKES